MRAALSDPFPDRAILGRAIEQAKELYVSHENGERYTAKLKAFSKLVGCELTKSAVDSAFGSIHAEAFAKRCLLTPAMIPQDLTRDELLELVRRVGEADGDEFQHEFWLRCLEENTGDKRIRELIYWPGSYFGDGNDAREMTPRQILETALKAKRKLGRQSPTTDN